MGRPLYAEIEAAAQRIAPYIRRTPLVRSAHLSDLSGGEIYLKLECWQHLAAFKVRGMVNRTLTLTEDERRLGLVVASSGNHGVAAAWCGQQWGMPVTVYVPETAPEPKLAKIRQYGARLRLQGRDYDAAHLAAQEYLSSAPGAAIWVDSCSDPDAVAGHGTVGLEIASELPRLDEVLVPIGGGGLVTGIGLALRQVAPRAIVTGVQTAACPAMAASLGDRVCYETYPSEPSLCDALIGGVGELGFRRAGECLDRVVLTSEDAIGQAVTGMIRHEQLLAEPAGAVGWAYIAERPEEFRGRCAAVVVSGGNLSYDVLTRLIRGTV